VHINAATAQRCEQPFSLCLLSALIEPFERDEMAD
jgi:hypothetical protein